MTSAVELEFDPFSEDYFVSPYETYRRMRDHAPVYFNEKYKFWALFRYEDVSAAHLDWETFSSSHGVDLSTLSQPPELIAAIQSLIMLDPPQHTTLRALVNKAFTPRAVEGLEPMIREVIGSYLDPFDDADSFDAVGDFSGPFPVEVISRMLGVPAADRQQIRHWLDASLHREPGQMDPSPEGITAIFAQMQYFLDLVADKRNRNDDDMISRLIAAEVEGEDGEPARLSDQEIANFVGLLGGAGAETVTKLVGNAVVLFHRNPEQWQKVLDDPAKAQPAVDEVLRYWPPSQYQGRFSLRDAEVSGTKIPAGSPVLLITGSATRDERFYEDADAFDIDRPPSMALGFGYGIHRCLGAALAKMESRVAIEELARRWPKFRVDEERCTRVHMSNVAGYASVPVVRVR